MPQSLLWRELKVDLKLEVNDFTVRNTITIICNKVEEYNVNEQWICILLTGSYFKPSDATMVSARSRTSAPMSAFKHTHNLNILWHDRFLTCISYYRILTLASHGHCDVNIDPQFTIHGKQKGRLKKNKPIWCNCLVLSVNLTCRNLCPLHTHTSSMCLYTQRIPGRQV